MWPFRRKPRKTITDWLAPLPTIHQLYAHETAAPPNATYRYWKFDPSRPKGKRWYMVGLMTSADSYMFSLSPLMADVVTWEGPPTMIAPNGALNSVILNAQPGQVITFS